MRMERKKATTTKRCLKEANLRISVINWFPYLKTVRWNLIENYVFSFL